MDHKQLGTTDIQVPEIGLGTWAYTGGAEPLQRGVDLGASLIDTAESYGTEEAVGAAIRGIRDRVFLATKVSPEHLRTADVLRAADRSLQRMGVDWIDLYQVHWPNASIPIEETMRRHGQLGGSREGAVRGRQQLLRGPAQGGPEGADQSYGRFRTKWSTAW